MTILFITGLSGVGKTSVLNEMSNRGFHTVDFDDGYIKSEENERLFDADKIYDLIENHTASNLILAGTESNQGEFYTHFDFIILLTTDLETMFDRIDKRINNPYGKSEEERLEIIRNYSDVLPLLKVRADLILDTTHQSVNEICDQLETLF